MNPPIPMNPMNRADQETLRHPVRWRVMAVAAGALGLAFGTVDAAVEAVLDGPMTSTQLEAESEDDLAKILSNPIADMISVPFQNNFDWGGGPRGDGFQYKMNFQPVIPFQLNECWNLITRTIVPMIQQDDVAGSYARPSGSQFGLGDTLFSAWLSPAKPTSSGWIWGVGPALLFPTGTDDMLTGNQWAAGPTAIALKMDGKFTYGALVNHVWSYAGTGGRPGVNQTFLQPFCSYMPGGGWTYSINTESIYNWQASQWTIPINLMVSKMFKIGKMPMQGQFGVRYYTDKPANGPDWGLRLSLTMLLPNG